MIAADHVAVRRNQGVLPDRHRARAEDLAVEPDVGTVSELDIAVLARQDRVPADEHAAANRDSAIRLSLCIDQAVIVDDDVVADADFVWMAEHDVLAEDHVPAAGAEKKRI